MGRARSRQHSQMPPRAKVNDTDISLLSCMATDPEFEHAYRCRENAPGRREHAVDWQYREDADGFMVAQLADHSLAPIFALTLAEWMVKRQATPGIKKALWDGKTNSQARG